MTSYARCVCWCVRISRKLRVMGYQSGEARATTPGYRLHFLRPLCTTLPRTQAMTETELYFAGGPDLSTWAEGECKGMTVRNEIRALNHLRKLLRANDASYKVELCTGCILK